VQEAVPLLKQRKKTENCYKTSIFQNLAYFKKGLCTCVWVQAVLWNANGTTNIQTPRKKITIANGNRKCRKKKQFADHSRVGSISDSSFKFLFEDCNSTLKYVTQHQAAPRIYCSTDS